MKTAIVYDYLPAIGGGAERALLEIANHFNFDVEFYFGFIVDSQYSRDYLAKLCEKYGKEKIHCGPTIKYFVPIVFRIMNFLLPSLLHSFNLQKFDLVITYSAFIAHSIIPPEKGMHIAYLNTPARFLWNLAHTKSVLKSLMSPFLITDAMRFRSQLYDLDGIFNTTKILAISAAVAERIKTFYNRDATVIYPAAVDDELLERDYDNLALRKELGTYYTHVSRVESYKNIDILLDAAMEGLIPETIVIMGHGPYLKSLKNKLRSKDIKPLRVRIEALKIDVEKCGNIIFTGYIEEAKKMQLLANASASFSLNDEDFGITKVESLAVGTPVIGLATGATPEILKDGKNGILYFEDTVSSLAEAIEKHKECTYDKVAIKKTARPFTISAFHINLDKILNA